MLRYRNDVSRNKAFLIPPNWLEAAVGFLCSIYIGFLIAIEVDPAYPKISPWVIEATLMFFVCRSLICYELHDTHLLVKLFLIPVRVIPWKKVCSAVYFPRMKCSYNIKRGACIILSIRHGLHFRILNVPPVMLRNPFSTIKIRLGHLPDVSCLNVVSQYVDLRENT